MSAAATSGIEHAARVLRMAARAVGRAGLAHAYGHCSLRLDGPRCLVTPPRPLALVGAGEACDVVDFAGALPAHVLGEVRVHRAIYQRRPDVGGIVRCMPPYLAVLGAHGVLPRARHGIGSYFHGALALWDDPQLLRSDAQADAVAAQLGAARAILLRGNGVVVVGATLEEAVVLTWYLEDMARIEWAGRAAGLGDAAGLDDAAAVQRATWSGAIRERMWDYLTHTDPESAPSPVTELANRT
jgi:HCOMODA/2-hydroxy-3-carboxy-muconic semialdehyde decarboxylase